MTIKAGYIKEKNNKLNFCASKDIKKIKKNKY